MPCKTEQIHTVSVFWGRPEVVQSYIDTKDLTVCYKNLDDLIMTLKDDFAKYRKRASITRLSEVFDSIVFQAGNKFKYSNIHSHSSSHALKDSVDLQILLTKKEVRSVCTVSPHSHLTCINKDAHWLFQPLSVLHK